ncbi:DUF7168 domain-containing protein [Chelatococcus reniformis]|uniref:DUF2786 domain-containing protein n=1 Tax=Chelatococcus reniformis TaxID=1494448 RepID=A0A916US22_9HYPH|nr:DUF2786 domain-containing protein [Chelatococcus reniformis]GGC85584.1 hypothetical protein GCM10010994_49360 [Chelatococcus reniformis]
MPLQADIDTDLAVQESIARQIDGLAERLVASGALLKTLRRWFAGHADVPESDGARVDLVAMATDLELFAPSISGRTMIDRHRSGSRPQTEVERQGLEALGAAQFRVVKIVGREDANVVRLEDRVTGESLLLLDTYIAPEAAGLTTAMRLCPLTSGRHAHIAPLFALDEAMVAAAAKFARPGRPLSDRCAASLYRDVARHGCLPIPQQVDEAALIDAIGEVDERMTAVEILACRWIGDHGADEAADLVLEARRLASVDTLVDTCGHFGQAGADAPQGLKAAFERIAELQVETIAQRARAGVGGHADALDEAATAIADFVTQGAMQAGARELFERLRARWAFSASERAAASASSVAETDRVIQRIQALRAKTVDRGCTEDEAMAAAAKVAELLDRHDLTLDEVSVRGSTCEGASIATGRKRRAPVDSCMPSLAEFCDCRAWSEGGGDSALRYVFFGLKADVEAARFLHELIEVTFETEGMAFRRGEIYQSLRGGDRRTALYSFQVGLASGISAKLGTLKAARRSSTSRRPGFDLVVAKHAVVDDEFAKLGLDFISRAARSRRYVHGDAYAAGKAAGALFEPNAGLSG